MIRILVALASLSLIIFQSAYAQGKSGDSSGAKGNKSPQEVACLPDGTSPPNFKGSSKKLRSCGNADITVDARFGPGGGGPAIGNQDPKVNWLVRQDADSRLQPLGNDLLGDSIDPNTGALSFTHTDVSVPGNSGLEVAIRRIRSQSWKYKDVSAVEFGDWQLGVPRITELIPAEGGYPANFCTQPGTPPSFSVTSNGSSGGEPQEINVMYRIILMGLAFMRQVREGKRF